ncbi:MAG: metallophosphoesterase family protein [Anaerolineales bacterium]|nr:metallophosphoesterase family protein [Anaerolineales bacterium]
MKILAVSDQVVERIYPLAASGHFNGVELILGCGDLPYSYLEYLVTMIHAPLFYVPGNHDPDFNSRDSRAKAEGGANLDLKLTRHPKALIGGFGGSVRYRPDGVNQYTQGEAYRRAFRLAAALTANRLKGGGGLDILISHSPPFGVHDDSDQAHQGLKALNWLVRFAKPRYHLHGHTHFYRNNVGQSETQVGGTKVINVYPYKVIEIE